MQNQPEPQDVISQARTLADRAVVLAKRISAQGVGPIGLDFGHSGVHAVQLTRKGGELQLRASGTIAYPGERDAVLADPEQLNELIQELLKDNGFKGNHAAVSAPLGQPKVLSLTFKSASPQETPRHVMELVKERLGGTDADWLVDYLPVNLKLKNAQDTMVMAAALPRQESLAFMQNLQSAGLNLRSVEIAPQAFERLLKHTRTPKDNCVVINFGWHKSYLSHYLHGRLTMDREITLGMADFVAPLSAALEIDPASGSQTLQALGFGERSEVTPLLGKTFSRLRKQIKLMDQYIASQLHGDGIDCVYLCGEVAALAGSESAFTRELGIRSKRLQPTRLLEARSADDELNNLQAMHAVAMGLALRWEE